MKWVFWMSAAFIEYTYFGYAGWLWLRKRLRPQPVKSASYTPLISIVMVVQNEAPVLRRKLTNLLTLDYPVDRFELIVVSDGSEDGSNKILAEYAKDPRVRTIISPAVRGKAAGLNEAAAVACGELVMFTDARQYIEPRAVRLLAENFADPDVGCVSGELMLGNPEAGEKNGGMGLYWRVEKVIRELESCSGSVVGATGAFYGVRREFLLPIPPETLLDDVYIPMQVVRAGSRVRFEPRARAWDVPDLGAEREFARKVRTLSGNYQLLQMQPWLLTRANPIRFEFISHKLLRLVIPFALLAALLACMFLAHPFYRAAFLLQLSFYAFSLLGMAHLKIGPITRVGDAAFTFVVLNTAAMVAFAKFVTGRKVAWTR